METEKKLLALSMLAEYTYCPRLFFLMYVEGLWDNNEFTEEGRIIHKRVDQKEDLLPNPSISSSSESNAYGDQKPTIVKSVTLSSELLGLSGKLDLVEVRGQEVVPVEYKRGEVPDTPERSWESQRVQLMAQAFLLREAGYSCLHGVIYFEASKTRVTILFDESLEKRTLALLQEAHDLVQNEQRPLPLENSPKCYGCSLAGICLPDETYVLRGEHHDEVTDIRRLYAPRSDAQPLYVQEQGATVGKSGENIVVTKKGETLLRVHTIDLSQIVLCGSIQITSAALHMCTTKGIPIVHESMGHWFYGLTQGVGLRNAFDRAAQFQKAANPTFCLKIAQSFVLAKGQNQRTLLRRNGDEIDDSVLSNMARYLKLVEQTQNLNELLGMEGAIAHEYFSHFSSMLKPKDKDKKEAFSFDMNGRNRRPPKDPVNACLSFLYSLLAKECTLALTSVGLDPYWGFFHRPRYGRPALALDLMEEFRPLIVDSAVLSAINTGMLCENSFETNGVACTLNENGRKALLKSYEFRMNQSITHPLFDYKTSWRRAIVVQAQLLAKVLSEEIPFYTGVITR